MDGVREFMANRCGLDPITPRARASLHRIAISSKKPIKRPADIASFQPATWSEKRLSIAVEMVLMSSIQARLGAPTRPSRLSGLFSPPAILGGNPFRPELSGCLLPSKPS
jgi:hypothetical protein